MPMVFHFGFDDFIYVFEGINSRFVTCRASFFLYQKQCIGKVLLLFFVKIRKLWYIVRGVKTVTASDCHFSTIFHSV